MGSNLDCHLVRVNLETGRSQREKLPEELRRSFLGGRALGAMLLYKELTPGIDPLAPSNKLVFSTGPLTATAAPGSPRYCVHTKSPLTGLYLMALSGGYFGPELKRTGNDLLMVEGKAEKPVYLLVVDEKVEIRDASAFWGMTTDMAQEFIREDVGDEKVRITCIGPAGEHLVPFACIVNERRVAARGGAGAVMGSKNLKAVVVRGTKKGEVAAPQRFREAVRQANRTIVETPMTGQTLPTYGSPGWVNLQNELGLLPCHNWQETSTTWAKEISGEVMRERYVVKAPHCAPPCPARCSKITLVRSGPHGGALTDGPEYETIYALGACCGISDLEAIIEADALCDKYGLDTMSMGVSLAFAMECYERGIISKADTGGQELTFGRAELLAPLIRDTAYRQGFGEILALGSKKMSERLGKGSQAFAMHAKGMELGGYDPRGARGLALTYACGPRGGCHHAGGYTALAEVEPPYDRFSNEGKATLVKKSRDRRVVCDSAIMCTFVAFGVTNEALAGLLSGATGMDLEVEDLYTIGDRGSNVERAFNVREGLRRSGDILPDRLLKEGLAAGPTKGQVVDLEPLLDDFYTLCGWDVKTGIPTSEKLTSLGLKGIAQDLSRLEV